MANDWKQKLGYNTIKAVPGKVNGETHQFYPISVAMAFELRSLAKPVAKAVAGLFSTGKKDTGSTTRNVKSNAEQGNQEVAEYVINAIDPQLAKLRNEQSAEAIESLFTAISERSTQEVIAKLVMDSLRDVFTRIDTPGQPVTFNITPHDFLQETPLPAMKDFVVGIFMANRAVLGPFGDMVEAKAKNALTNLDESKKSQPDAPPVTQSEPTNEQTTKIESPTATG